MGVGVKVEDESRTLLLLKDTVVLVQLVLVEEILVVDEEMVMLESTTEDVGETVDVPALVVVVHEVVVEVEGLVIVVLEGNTEDEGIGVAEHEESTVPDSVWVVNGAGETDAAKIQTAMRAEVFLKGVFLKYIYMESKKVSRELV